MSFGPLAYMDPGTGSMLLQLILGGVAGLFVIIRLFWHRILVVLGIKKEEAPPEPDSEVRDQQTNQE